MLSREALPQSSGRAVVPQGLGGPACSLLAPCCLSWEAQSSSGDTRGSLWAAHFQRAEVPWDCLGRVVGTKPPPSLLLVSFWAGPVVPSCSPDGQMSSEHPSFPFWMATTRISSAKTLLRAMLQLQAAAGLPVQVLVQGSALRPCHRVWGWGHRGGSLLVPLLPHCSGACELVTACLPPAAGASQISSTHGTAWVTGDTSWWGGALHPFLSSGFGSLEPLGH